jgi:radical SAM superfamily enzyme YgiQ (UPF0313 family)
MPQAIAVWCRQLGHQVFYATWYGHGDPKERLPKDLDVVFIACVTQASALAYALAKLYRMERTLTVMGGPHAKSFPYDCLRFFDLVVLQCDNALVADILAGVFERGSIISSGRALTDLPSVAERLPEIKASAFLAGRWPYLSATAPMLSSTGCPYTCNFCTDWNNPYVLLPLDHLAADLQYLSENLPRVKIAFHDPNFAVKFDQTLDVLEGLPEMARNPYVMESSLSVLRGPRLQRLRETNCVYVAPGIESWSSYSNKAGVGKITGQEKVLRVAEHVEELHEYVPGMQLNFIFGLDTDEGDEPVELTKEFLTRTPFAWPAINIPVPFGATPLFDDYLKSERILSSFPFAFYYFPYLVTTMKNYDPVTYYRKLIEICAHSATPQMLRQRLRSTPGWTLRLFHIVRTIGMRQQVRNLQRILHMLTTDPHFRAFHEGESPLLPEFYHREYERMLGPYASLLSRADRTPELTQMKVSPLPGKVGAS